MAATALDEHDSKRLLREYGLTITAEQIVEDAAQASAAAARIGYPVVSKTAAPGVLHKSDVGGSTSMSKTPRLTYT